MGAPANAQPPDQAPRGEEEHADRLQQLIDEFGNVRLQLSCELGETHMKLRALLSLKTGSIVAVDLPVEEDLSVRVNGVQLAWTDVAVVESQVKLRITGLSSDE